MLDISFDIPVISIEVVSYPGSQTRCYHTPCNSTSCGTEKELDKYYRVNPFSSDLYLLYYVRRLLIFCCSSGGVYQKLKKL